MNIKELRLTLRAMRDYGCIRLRTQEGLELELSPELIAAETQKSTQISQENLQDSALSQEEIDKLVFYSAPTPEGN